MGYLTESPEMGSGIIYNDPMQDPNYKPAGVEPQAPTATAPTVPATPGGGGGAQDTGQKGPTYGGGSSVVLNRDSPSGYTYVAGRSNRTNTFIRGWIPNDDPRFGNDYSVDFGLVDTLTYDDMIDPSKRYKPTPPPDFSQMFSGFSMPSFEMPSFEMPSFPTYSLPAMPASPATPAAPASTRAATSGGDRKIRNRRLSLLTGTQGTNASTQGSNKGKKRLLGA